MTKKTNPYNNFKAKSNHISITYTGLQPKNPTLSNQYIKTNFVFEYVVDGEGTFKINKKEYKVKKGDLVLIPINQLVQYNANRLNPFTYWWVDFFGPNVSYLLEQIGFTDKKHVIHYNDDKIAEFMEKIHLATISNKLSGRLSALGYFFELLAHLTTNKKDFEFRRNFIDEYIERAVWYIHTYFSNDIKVKDIAEHVNLSEFYLTTIFTKKMGTSPIDFLINYRIEQAQNMLTTPDIPITFISANCGFNSSSYFTMRFKQITGMTPKEFRKMNSEKLKNDTPPPKKQRKKPTVKENQA